MSLLGLVILFIAAMNYVLISISSLARRAKAIGVHKCNGASERNIFSMFLWETGIIIMISLILVGVLVLNFREDIEYLASASIGVSFHLGDFMGTYLCYRDSVYSCRHYSGTFVFFYSCHPCLPELYRKKGGDGSVLYFFFSLLESLLCWVSYVWCCFNITGSLRNR